MEHRPIRSWVAHVRDGLLVAAVAVAASLSTTGLRADSSDRITGLLRRLADSRFEVRTAAERELAGLKAPDLELLEKAASQDAEHAARIIAIIERLYIGQSAREGDDNPARAALLSSVECMLRVRRAGDYGETEVTQAAEGVLARLAEGNSPAASLAAETLERHAFLAESRAIATLRRLGARVIFSDRRDGMHEALNQFADGATSSPDPVEQVSPPAPLSIEHVYVLRSWKGGRDGLEHLARLRTVGGLQLYLVDGCGITVDDILPLKAEIPGLSPIQRSAATLGVRSSGYQFLENGGCEIAGVTEGLAADRAGLRTNFIIRAVDGDPILTFDDGTPRSLVQRLRDCKPHDVVTLTVEKTMNAGPVDVQVTLSDWSDVPDVQMMGHR